MEENDKRANIFLSLACVFACRPQYHSCQRMHAGTKLADLILVTACISGHISVVWPATGLLTLVLRWALNSKFVQGVLCPRFDSQSKRIYT